jgi:hypothetical protein
MSSTVNPISRVIFFIGLTLAHLLPQFFCDLSHTPLFQFLLFGLQGARIFLACAAEVIEGVRKQRSLRFAEKVFACQVVADKKSNAAATARHQPQNPDLTQLEKGTATFFEGLRKTDGHEGRPGLVLMRANLDGGAHKMGVMAEALVDEHSFFLNGQRAANACSAIRS